VVRVRQTLDRGSGDSTIKLRPCWRSQLSANWLAREEDGDVEVRVEEDWSGDRRVLVVSCEAKLNRETIELLDNDKQAPGAVFTPAQEQFLAECGPPGKPE
jgi:hypothetical protein